DREGKAVAGPADDVARPDLEAVERKLRVVAAAVAELDAGHRLPPQPRPRRLDQERRDAVLALSAVEPREHDRDVGDAAVGDPDLVAGQRMAAAAPLGARAQRRGRPARLRLGEG